MVADDSNSDGARPVHLIITMIKWIRTRRLSIKNSLSGLLARERTFGDARLDASVKENTGFMTFALKMASGFTTFVLKMASGFRVQGIRLAMRDWMRRP